MKVPLAEPARRSASDSYQIVPYRDEHKSQVAKLLCGLWSSDLQKNLDYFEWKFEDNPCVDMPLGILAIYKGEVVGFRGYFAVGLEIGGSGNRFVALTSADACVSPEHRRKGISVLIGARAKEEYARQYPLFMNMSCSSISLPGYRKMGFLSILERTYLTRASILGSLRYVFSDRSAELSLDQSAVDFGRSGNVEISGKPRADEMAALRATGDPEDGKIRPFQDSKFYSWRFRNPLSKYVFYYLYDEEKLTGFIAVGVSPNNRRGFILDFGYRDEQSLWEILTFLAKSRHFDVLSVYEFCIDRPMSHALHRLGFRPGGLISLLERKLHGALPFLIRPIRDIYSEDELMPYGIDARDIENWSLRPICSDGV